MAIAVVPKGRYVNKPANSYSSGDILRIIASNLTRQERGHLIYFFLVVIPAMGFVQLLIEEFLLALPPTGLLSKILKAFRVWNSFVERINPIDATLLLLVLPEEPRIEGKKLLDKLKRDGILE